VPDSGGAGGVRVGVAFNDATLEPTPTWTYLTETPNLVAGYTIDRGRQYEFDKTDTGKAVVSIYDREGVLDPRNSLSPYNGLLEPLLQIQIELLNPVTDVWWVRYRGFIEDFDYGVEPFTHQNSSGDTVGLTRLEISCVDLFEILTAIEMYPDGSFGDDPTTASPDATGNIFFDTAGDVKARIDQVMGNAGVDAAFYVAFTGNVQLMPTVYSPGDNVLQPIQDGADAEFPTVSNVYCDRKGRLVFHGRLAKFDPHGTWLSIAGSDPARDAVWRFREWNCGDGQAVAASITDTAQIRTFAFNRGLSKIFNSAFCTPNGFDPKVDDPVDQTVQDTASITQFGIRSWSAENLLIASGNLTGFTGKEECAAFAAFVVANNKTPRERITDISFRSMRPTDPRAAANWALICEIDISDLVNVTVTNPGSPGASFNAEPFYVEGLHEEVKPMTGEYADVTLRPDLSPQAYFTETAGLDG